MISLILEWISTIMFVGGGIIGTTKYGLKIKIRIGLCINYLIANFMWFMWCILDGSWGWIWTGAVYTILGILSIINFSRIYKKLKKDENYLKLL